MYVLTGPMPALLFSLSPHHQKQQHVALWPTQLHNLICMHAQATRTRPSSAPPHKPPTKGIVAKEAQFHSERRTRSERQKKRQNDMVASVKEVDQIKASCPSGCLRAGVVNGRGSECRLWYKAFSEGRKSAQNKPSVCLSLNDVRVVLHSGRRTRRSFNGHFMTCAGFADLERRTS